MDRSSSPRRSSEPVVTQPETEGAPVDPHTLDLTGADLTRLKEIDQKIIAYCKGGKRPTQSTPGFSINSWLWKRGSSLSKRCDYLFEARGIKIGPLLNLNRTEEEIDQKIIAYCEKEGKRPTKSTPDFEGINDWLAKKGSSISKRCDYLFEVGKIKVQPLRNLNRTEEEVDLKIISYCEKEGKRPSLKTPDFEGINDWLAKRGSSLAQRCDYLFEAGKIKVGPLYNLNRTEEEVDQKIIAYCEKEGKRPTRSTLGFGSTQGWLVNRGSSLAQRCHELWKEGKLGDAGAPTRWDHSRLVDLVRSLLPFISSGSLTYAQCMTVVMQSSPEVQRKVGAVLGPAASGTYSPEDIEAFQNGEEGSKIEGIIKELDEVEDSDVPDPYSPDPDEGSREVNVGCPGEDDTIQLPNPTTTTLLKGLGNLCSFSPDEEAVKFIIDATKQALWNVTVRDEKKGIRDLKVFKGEGYPQEVRDLFLAEYNAARDLPLPKGYHFSVNGKLSKPFLMQRVVATRLQRDQYLGNWSDMGTGKTLSAILASRVVDAHLSVILCPNSCIQGWEEAIRDSFSNSEVQSKTFSPTWESESSYHYLILNFEKFQQTGSDWDVKQFTGNNVIDLLVIDEVQHVKQRGEDPSKRRQAVLSLRAEAKAKNPNLYVLGMSGTPVINNLKEAVALIEMVTGREHNDIDTKTTEPNCIKVHQHLTRNGVRWQAPHKAGHVSRVLDVDCSTQLVDLEQLFTTWYQNKKLGGPSMVSILELEEILTRARLPYILKEVANAKGPVLIYSHFIGKPNGSKQSRIDTLLLNAIAATGKRVGCFTGEEKQGLNEFKHGNLDVLIASATISVGVDGLQHVCNKLIFNILPWTSAEYDQIIARLDRQWQTSQVDVVIPLPKYSLFGDTAGAWYETFKMDRIKKKRTIANAAVDGIPFGGYVISQEKALQDHCKWVARLIENGAHQASGRKEVESTLSDIEIIPPKKLKRFGDFSKMNGRWNKEDADKRHARITKDPSEWHYYHSELDRVRVEWTSDPQKDFIQWAKRRKNLVIGDFGCGRATVASTLKAHTVHSFDHVASVDGVIAGNMAKTPLEDETLDVALFCLSLMGSSPGDYLREAYRTLTLDGLLHIYEPTSKFKDRTKFAKYLKKFGFSNVEVLDCGNFTHISAKKSEYQPVSFATISFGD